MSSNIYLSADAGVSAAPFLIRLPPGTDIQMETVTCQWQGAAASSLFKACLSLYAQDGTLLSRTFPSTILGVGDSAEVTYAPFLDDVVEVEANQKITFGELGANITTALGLSCSSNIVFDTAELNDGVLVLAMAPSLSALAATEGFPVSCSDTKGNTYTLIGSHNFQASPAAVNDGIYVGLFYCASVAFPLSFDDGDDINVTWDNAVYDRYVSAWVVRHDGGASAIDQLASTADHDAAVYASAQVTQVTPAWTPARDESMMVAMVVSAKAGGMGGFGGVGGFSFSQVQFRQYTGIKQRGFCNLQTHGADIFLKIPLGGAQFELDLGKLEGGTLIAAFNGPSQFYTAAAPHWKGIILLGLD